MSSSTSEKPQTNWRPQRSLRRFPENINSRTLDDENDLRNNLEVRRGWMSLDSEHDDRERNSLLSSSLMKSSSSRSPEASSSPNAPFAKRLNSSPPLHTSSDDPSFNHLINYMSSQTKSVSKIKATPQKDTERHSPEKVSPTKKTQDPESFVNHVLQNGEYLLKDQSWHKFRGEEEVAKCSKAVIERNENIWELLSVEYSHLKLLVNIRNVYYKSYPYLEAGSSQSTGGPSLVTNRSDSNESSRSISDSKDRKNNLFESVDIILPGMEELIQCHARICNCLVTNHQIRPDRVITEIGRVLHESIPDDLIPTLAELYGRINYTKQNINQKLSQFKKYPVFLSYIHKCERDPRCDKKTLADILLHISIHWSKKVTTLNSIISNTRNDSQDEHNLATFKGKVDRIVNGASNVMDKHLNLKLLQSLIGAYEVSFDMEDSDRVFELMKMNDAKLIYSGKVYMELKKSSNGRLFSQELHGVALETCIFFLQIINEPGKTTPRYQLFKDRDSDFPALLEWGRLYGYFREEDSRNSSSFSFYVIIEKPNPSIKRLNVGTQQDRNNWKKCIQQGFSMVRGEVSDIKDFTEEADNKLNEDMRKIENKWANTQLGIELINHLNDSLRVQLEYRTVGFRCVLEEELKRITQAKGKDVKADDMEQAKLPSVDNYLTDLSTTESIQNWLEMFMEWVNRLKFSLCSSGANITRSASEIEGRKRPSVPIVKKYDTFTSRDSPTYEKRPPDVTFHNPTPIMKQKKDQRRISVTGFTNLFRKSVKAEGEEKASDLTNTIGRNGECELDNMTLSNPEMGSQADEFLSCLSKDAVVAFNEINTAAKNITMEIINVRTKNMILEAEVKKLQDEKNLFKEFLSKFQKCMRDGNFGPIGGNNGQVKCDGVSSPPGMSGINFSNRTESMTEGLELLNENSSGLAQTNQKMVECRIQTENLRQMYEKFAQEKKKWEKDYDNQRCKIENDREKLFHMTMELNKEKESLTEKENKYKENCINLQKKIDMYTEAYGTNLDAEPRTEILIQPISKLQLISESQVKQYAEEIQSRRNSKEGAPPLASTEATQYGNDPLHNSKIPDQLKGSLINQLGIANQNIRRASVSRMDSLCVAKQKNRRTSVSQTDFERPSLKTNSFDNILDSGVKPSGYVASKPRMTPSIERKQKYSGNNTSSLIDENEDRNCSSDFDDAQTPPTANAKDHMTSRKSIASLISNTISIYDGHRGSPMINSGSDTFNIHGFPLELAERSKFKKEKSKKAKFK